MQVQQRYRDIDFVAYLLTIGLKYDKIETVYTTNSGKKTFVYFTGEKEMLVQYKNDFMNAKVVVNAFEFAKNRRYISREIRKSYDSFGSNN